MVVEHSFTPPLQLFADVSETAAKEGDKGEFVLQTMTLAKASGYVLASMIIAAEQMDNIALGLRLLTAAGKAEGCAPDRGDYLVCSLSKAAQRASTLLHKRAIDKALDDNNW